MNTLQGMLETKDHRAWMADVASWKQAYPLRQVSPSQDGVTPQEVLETLNRLTGSQAIIATEVGQHQMGRTVLYLLHTAPIHLLRRPGDNGLWARSRYRRPGGKPGQAGGKHCGGTAAFT